MDHMTTFFILIAAKYHYLSTIAEVAAWDSPAEALSCSHETEVSESIFFDMTSAFSFMNAIAAL